MYSLYLRHWTCMNCALVTAMALVKTNSHIKYEQRTYFGALLVVAHLFLCRLSILSHGRFCLSRIYICMSNFFCAAKAYGQDSHLRLAVASPFHWRWSCDVTNTCHLQILQSLWKLTILQMQNCAIFFLFVCNLVCSKLCTLQECRGSTNKIFEKCCTVHSIGSACSKQKKTLHICRHQESIVWARPHQY